LARFNPKVYHQNEPTVLPILAKGSKGRIMPFLEWKPVFSVGVEMIDSQHQKLIGFMNAFYNANEVGNSVAANTALNSLVVFTKAHFADEEKLMVKCAYPDLVAHQKLHRDLLTLVQKLVTNYFGDPTVQNATALANFLKNWLVNHILGVDKKYVPFMPH
jgi:hemerythrin